MCKNNKGHSYITLFGKNLAIIYRHHIWKAPIIYQKGELSNAQITMVDFDSSRILFNSEFNLKTIDQDILSYPKLVFGKMAIIDNKVVGYCMIYRSGSATQQYKIEHADAYIDDVCVDEAYRGQGIAPKMLKRVIIDLQQAGCKNIILAVRRNNISMIKSISKLGFSLVKPSISIRVFGKRVVYPTL